MIEGKDDWGPKTLVATSKITAKYQTTIPTEVRRLLDAEAGDKLVYYARGHRVELEIVKKKRARDLYGALQQQGEEYVPLSLAREITQSAIAERKSIKE
jgi:AbrB family looped-hinge helix DNA binding protein